MDHKDSFSKFGKRLLYKITLLHSVVRHRLQGENWPWWNKLDDDIIVGALPLQKHKPMQELLSQHISGVLSVVEPEELEVQSRYIKPMGPRYWKGIPHQYLNIPDYQPIEVQQIEKGIAFIESHRKKGPVYVHCKAGRGRSIVIAACYLLKKHHHWTPEDALHYIATKRPHIAPNTAQINSIKTYYKHQHK